MIGIFTSTSCKDEGTGWTPDMIPDDEVEVPDYDEEKFIVVISKLRGCAIQRSKNYLFRRRKKGKEKVRTWKKLRG